MILQERIYRTVDGRLVREGDLDAAFLEFAAGAEIPDATARKLGLDETDAVASGIHAEPESSGSGLTITAKPKRSRSRPGKIATKK